MNPLDVVHRWCGVVENTPFATTIAESSWIFPSLEVAHVVGLATVVGTIAIIDLRLLDLASRNRAIGRLTEETLPFTWAGFALALTTGSLMFASKATKYIDDIPFRIKMVFLLLAGLNMLAFHLLTYRTVEHWDEGVRTPRAAKIAGGTSLALWTAIVFLGRWIAFTMS